jgi:hypothetical protein
MFLLYNIHLDWRKRDLCRLQWSVPVAFGSWSLHFNLDWFPNCKNSPWELPTSALFSLKIFSIPAGRQAMVEVGNVSYLMIPSAWGFMCCT